MVNYFREHDWLGSRSRPKDKAPSAKQAAAAARDMSVTKAGGKCTASLRCPRPGHVYVDCDLSQLETRVLAWVAREEPLLQAFADNRDVYSEFATDVFKRDVHDPTEGDTPDVAKELKALRQVGMKAMRLLGFSMEGPKFMLKLKEDPSTSPLFERGDLGPIQCDKIVELYRKRHPAIVNLWSVLDDSARRLTVGNRRLDWGELILSAEAGEMQIQLPSDGRLYYPHIRLVYHGEVIKRRDTISRYMPGVQIVYGPDLGLDGGKLTKDIVQEEANDILVKAIKSLEAQGYPVVQHTRDEVVLEIPEADADRAAKALTEVFSVKCELRLPLSRKVQVRRGSYAEGGPQQTTVAAAAAELGRPVL